MSAVQRNEVGLISLDLESGQSPSEYRLVRMSDAARTVRVCGAGEGARVLGAYQESTLSVDPDKIAVFMKNHPGTVIVTVSVAVSIGDTLYCAASGKVTNVPNGSPVGKAMTAGSGDGAQIEMTWVNADSSLTDFGEATLGGNALTAAQYAASESLLVGMVRYDSYGNKYKFVKYDNGAGNIEAPLGTPVGVYSTDAVETTVTADYSDSSEASIAGIAASVFNQATGALIYGWIMISGSLATALNGTGLTLTTDGNVAQHQVLRWHGDNEVRGVTYTATMTDAVFFGRAGAADASTSLTQAQICCEAVNAHGVA